MNNSSRCRNNGIAQILCMLLASVAAFADEQGNAAAALSTANACPRIPTNIRVQVGSATYAIPFRDYLRHVLANEWIGEWGDLNERRGMESLYAGATAVRTYATGFVNYPYVIGNNKYDICSTDSCQVYDPNKSHSNADAAVDYTATQVLANASGNITQYMSEYSRENNNHGCFDGFAGDASAAGPCIEDSVCKYIPRDSHSHGRGMCQNGSARWATGYYDLFTVPHSLNGQEPRDAMWILRHYYGDRLHLASGAVLDVGASVRVARRDNLEVHDCGGDIDAGVNCPTLGSAPSTASGTILDGPALVESDGYKFTWWQVAWSTGLTGWSAENWLEFAVGTGNIEITATLDGKPWAGPLEYRIGGAGRAIGSFVPGNHAGRSAGGYTIHYESGGPINAGLPNVDPPQSLNLAAGATISWSFRFTSGGQCSASVLDVKARRGENAAACQSCFRLTPGVSPAGGGTVVLNTPADCAGGYTSGRSVSISASAESGYLFGSWSSTNCSLVDRNASSTNCVMTGLGDATVTASFASASQPPPAAYTGAADSVTTSHARLNGSANANGIATEVFYFYGTGTGEATTPSRDIGSGTSTVPFEADLDGLACGTTFHFAAGATNAGGSRRGSDSTFTTSPCSTTGNAPTVTTNAASGIGETWATLNGTMNANGSLAFSTGFEYGLAIPYADSVGAQNYGDSVQHAIYANALGLTCGTTYHFRAEAENASGITYGNDATFTTSPCVAMPPTVTTDPVSNLDRTNATLNGTVNPNGSLATVAFEYGTSNQYGSSVGGGVLSGSTPQPANVDLHDLVCNTSYHYRVSGSSVAGVSNGFDTSFRTLPCVQQMCDPMWTGGPSMDTFAQADTLMLGDVDGDGRNDVAVSVYDAGVVRLFRNLSTENSTQFGAPIDIQSGSNPEGLALAEFDGDGRPDLIVANAGGGNISLFRNITSQGSIGFARIAIESVNTPHQLAVADFDRDGKLDFAVTSNSAKQVNVFRNRSTVGTLAFELSAVLPAAGFLAPIAAGDLDGDGRPDLIVPVEDNGAVYAFRNISTGPAFLFEASGSWPTGSRPTSIAVADLDNDGKSDVVVANAGSNTLALLRNVGGSASIAFDSPLTLTTGSAPRAVSVRDLDDDGRADILAVNSGADTILVSRNLSAAGALLFAPLSTVSVGSLPVASAAGDLDGDGRHDLVIALNGSHTIVTRLNRAMTPSSLPIGVVAQDYPTTTFAQSGTTVTFESGDIPPGMTFVGATLSGTPTSAGTFRFIVSAATPNACVNARTYNVVVRSAVPTFTDDPLVPRQTIIRAIHAIELRSLVNELRRAAGLDAFAFSTNITLGRLVSAKDIEELRVALAQARAALGFRPLAFANLLVSGAVIRAVDVEELRAGLR